MECIPNLRTARINQDSREEAPTIQIPARDFSQRTHDYSQKIANRLIQYGLALHEHGHDRYTPGPFLKEIFNRAEFSQPYSDLYWDCINGFEDYRIENALIQGEGKWAEERLMFTHHNFTYVPPEQTPNPKNITWATAIQSATIHYGKARETFDFQPMLEDDSNESLQWRSPQDKQIYAAVLPELKQTLDAVGFEPDGKAAVRRMIEFVHDLDEFLDELSESPPEREQGQEDSVDNSGDDSQNDMGSEKESAESLEQSDEGNNQDISSDSDSLSETPDKGRGSSSGSEQENEDSGANNQQKKENETGEGESATNKKGTETEAEETAESERDKNSDSGKEEEEQDTDPESPRAAADDESPESDNQEDRGSCASGQQAGEPTQDSTNGDEGVGGETAKDDSAKSSDSEENRDSSVQTEGQQENNQATDVDQQEDSRPEGEDEAERDDGEAPIEKQSGGSGRGEAEAAQETGQEPESALVEREGRKASREERKLERDKQELEREIERLQVALEGGNGEVDRLRMVDPSDEPTNAETWEEIITESHILKGPLQQSLQQNQTTDERRGTRTGTFEPSLSHRLSVNNLAINKQTTDGQKKSYSVVLVLDRSGSMARQISTAEVAIGGFALALEQLGVNVAIVDLYRGNARMVKPFGTPTRQVRSNLTSGKTGGGTPLTDALVVSRERIRQEPHYPFMFVVSDGKPHDRERYLAALSETHFPVVGVTLSQSSHASKFDEYYDICRTSGVDGIGDELVSLATEIMF
ncbi:hypothetical protein D3D01_15530 [Haloarcula sp. Atlit-7R]|nr:hypothetical protein D3D01_15530 [Haloarcula sp. Atlit-7R]